MKTAHRRRFGWVIALCALAGLSPAGAEVTLLSHSTLVSDTAMGPSLTAVTPVPGSIVSGDGRYLVFLSRALNLAAGQIDTPGTLDAFLFDRLSQTSLLVSHLPGEPTSDDRTTGANRLVSRTLADALRTGNGPSTEPAISADGRSVLFTSAAGDLTAGDYNGTTDVFLDRAPTHPGAYFTIPPCRVTDSRLTGAALFSNGARTLPLHAHCAIPSTARAVSLNLTILAGKASGFVTLYAGDQAPPATSTLNFRSGQVKANNAVVPLATDGSGLLALKAAYAGTGPVQVIVDVNGYFE